jgi:hypothetical protein
METLYFYVQFLSRISRAVNDTFLIVYLTRIVSDKTGMSNVLFSLGHWVWVKKNFINLSGMDMGKGFSLPVIHWVNYINIYKYN